VEVRGSTACFLNKVFLKDPHTCFDTSGQWKKWKMQRYSIYHDLDGMFGIFPR
jgi:hypothetical protein